MNTPRSFEDKGAIRELHQMLRHFQDTRYTRGPIETYLKERIKFLELKQNPMDYDMLNTDQIGEKP